MLGAVIHYYLTVQQVMYAHRSHCHVIIFNCQVSRHMNWFTNVVYDTNSLIYSIILLDFPKYRMHF